MHDDHDEEHAARQAHSCARLGFHVVMADDPCEAAFGTADPTGPRKYYRARYYDPRVGRFLTEDPLGSERSDDLYAYLENRPTLLTDPMGLSSNWPPGSQQDCEARALEEMRACETRAEGRAQIFAAGCVVACGVLSPCLPCYTGCVVKCLQTAIQMQRAGWRACWLKAFNDLKDCQTRPPARRSRIIPVCTRRPPGPPPGPGGI